MNIDAGPSWIITAIESLQLMREVTKQYILDHRMDEDTKANHELAVNMAGDLISQFENELAPKDLL